jgi:hypothetical protein
MPRPQPGRWLGVVLGSRNSGTADSALHEVLGALVPAQTADHDAVERGVDGAVAAAVEAVAVGAAAGRPVPNSVGQLIEVRGLRGRIPKRSRSEYGKPWGRPHPGLPAGATTARTDSAHRPFRADGVRNRASKEAYAPDHRGPWFRLQTRLTQGPEVKIDRPQPPATPRSGHTRRPVVPPEVAGQDSACVTWDGHTHRTAAQNSGPLSESWSRRCPTLETGSGTAPHSIANAASLRSRSGLSPAVTSRVRPA